MKCKDIRLDGKKCRSNAMKGEEFCWIHHPEVSPEEKRNARAKGGSNKGIPKHLMGYIHIENEKDIPKVLIDTIYALRGKKLEAKTAIAIGNVCSQLLKSYEVIEYVKRIEKLEKATAENDTGENINILEYSQINNKAK